MPFRSVRINNSKLAVFKMFSETGSGVSHADLELRTLLPLPFRC